MSRLTLGVFILAIANQVFASYVLVLSKQNSQVEYIAPGYDSAKIVILSEPEPKILIELDGKAIPVNIDYKSLKSVDIFSAKLATYSETQKELLLIIECTNEANEITGDIRIKINGYSLGEPQINEECGL